MFLKENKIDILNFDSTIKALHIKDSLHLIEKSAIERKAELNFAEKKQRR